MNAYKKFKIIGGAALVASLAAGCWDKSTVNSHFWSGNLSSNPSYSVTFKPLVWDDKLNVGYDATIRYLPEEGALYLEDTSDKDLDPEMVRYLDVPSNGTLRKLCGHDLRKILEEGIQKAKEDYSKKE